MYMIKMEIIQKNRIWLLRRIKRDVLTELPETKSEIG